MSSRPSPHPISIYSGVEHCVHYNIIRLNNAAKKGIQEPFGEDESCGICRDTLSTNEGYTLAASVLQCKHRFHEFCIMKWLSPIKLPITESIPLQPAAQTCNGKDHIGDTDFENRTLRQLFSYSYVADRMLELGIDPFNVEDNLEEVLQPLLRMLDRQLEEQQSEDDAPPRSAPDNGDPGSHGAIVEIPPQNGMSGSQMSSFQLYYRNAVRQRLMARSSGPVHSHCCPVCRQPALAFPACHGDTLLLLRVRLRLTDLAYAFLRLERSASVKKDRMEIITFLHRRQADYTAQGEREIMPSLSDRRLIFHHARFVLWRKARLHQQKHGQSPKEPKRLQYLSLLLRHFKFTEAFVPFFFDPNPEYDSEIRLNLSAQDREILRHDVGMLSKALELYLDKKLVKPAEMETGAEGSTAGSMPQNNDDGNIIGLE
ncbi:MAG: hypothetical protein Q9216_002022 [Gyalolechia sp. 2 TL-2023]